MKAAQISQYGDASVVQINEVEVPKITSGQVLVEVHASSLNPFDTIVRAGYMKDNVPLAFPATLGGDIAGIVTEVAPDVTHVAVGDKVYGQAYVLAGNSGAFAEYAAVTANQIAKMPSNMTFIQAGSLPLVGVSALQAIRYGVKLQPGGKLFIDGGAGAIGSVAIQIAKSIGIRVTTTATADDAEFIEIRGADEMIDYKTTIDVTAGLSGFDGILETVSAENLSKTLSILKPGGIAVSMVGGADEAKAQELGVTVINQQTKVTTELLDELTKLIEQDIITTSIAKSFPLEEIQKAFTLRETEKVRTKVVIEIKNN